VLDSVLVPRLLRAYTTDAVTLFGLFTGGAVTVINLPVSICYGLAVASIPRIAAVKEQGGSLRKNIFFSLGITALVSGVSAVGLYLFAEPAANVIFHSLSSAELATLVRLIKIFSVSALTLSCVQTLSACLTAQGEPQHAALSMAIAMTVKTGLYVFWLRDPSVSVFGLAYATNIAYAVAFLFDLLYNMSITRKKRMAKI
jgi:O-antigen/teichoic acid export membrane protein